MSPLHGPSRFSSRKRPLGPDANSHPVTKRKPPRKSEPMPNPQLSINRSVPEAELGTDGTAHKEQEHGDEEYELVAFLDVGGSGTRAGYIVEKKLKSGETHEPTRQASEILRIVDRWQSQQSPDKYWRPAAVFKKTQGQWKAETISEVSADAYEKYPDSLYRIIADMKELVRAAATGTESLFSVQPPELESMTTKFRKEIEDSILQCVRQQYHQLRFSEISVMLLGIPASRSTREANRSARLLGGTTSIAVSEGLCTAAYRAKNLKSTFWSVVDVGDKTADYCAPWIRPGKPMVEIWKKSKDIGVRSVDVAVHQLLAEKNLEAAKKRSIEKWLSSNLPRLKTRYGNEYDAADYVSLPSGQCGGEEIHTCIKEAMQRLTLALSKFTGEQLAMAMWQADKWKIPCDDTHIVFMTGAVIYNRHFVDLFGKAERSVPDLLNTHWKAWSADESFFGEPWSRVPSYIDQRKRKRKRKGKGTRGEDPAPFSKVRLVFSSQTPAFEVLGGMAMLYQQNEQGSHQNTSTEPPCAVGILLPNPDHEYPKVEPPHIVRWCLIPKNTKQYNEFYVEGLEVQRTGDVASVELKFYVPNDNFYWTHQLPLGEKPWVSEIKQCEFLAAETFNLDRWEEPTINCHVRLTFDQLSCLEVRVEWDDSEQVKSAIRIISHPCSEGAMRLHEKDAPTSKPDPHQYTCLWGEPARQAAQREMPSSDDGAAERGEGHGEVSEMEEESEHEAG